MIVACVAPGPSLPRLALDRLAGCDLVLAVSLAFRFLPRPPHVVYACDGRWWDSFFPEARATGAALWSAHKRAAQQYRLNHIRVEPEAPGFSTDKTYVHGGGNSGYQALNLAMHLGATKALLVGYDMKPDEHGKQHAFGEYSGSMYVPKMPFDYFVDQFAKLPPIVNGMSVVNCTPGSRLTMFPYQSLEQAI